MIRTALTMLTALAVLCGTAAIVRAQGPDADQPKKTEPKSKDSADAKAKRIEFLRLRIKELRTRADLLEEKIAEKPDQEKIAKLEKELKQLRTQMQKLLPPPPRDGRGRGGNRNMGPGGPGGPNGGWDNEGPGPRPGPGAGDDDSGPDSRGHGRRHQGPPPDDDQ